MLVKHWHVHFRRTMKQVKLACGAKKTLDICCNLEKNVHHVRVSLKETHLLERHGHDGMKKIVI